MKIGRNDPCRCGSGKKYKKCCLPKDQEAERAGQPALTPDPLPLAEFDESQPLEPPDPRIEAFNARWEEFEAQDYAGQIALFTTSLDEPELMDEEMAFEMLETIRKQSVQHAERDRFDTLVDLLRERLPDVYASNAHYYLESRITSVVVAGRVQDLPALANELAQTAGRRIDTFDNVMAQLAYHGQLSVLVEAMQRAWPLVQESNDIVPWGISEFAEQAANLSIYRTLEQTPSLNPTDPTLLEQLQVFIDVVPERLADSIGLLTDQTPRHWTLSDFEFAPPKKRRKRPRDGFDDDFDEHSEEDEEKPPVDKAAQNLIDLSFAFLGYLHREEGVSYAKGELARQGIYRYILDRHAGKLEERESMLEAVTRRKPKPKPKPREPVHLLCPDRQTLDRYLDKLLNLLSFQPYRVAATLELVPAWLRFLESRQLLDTQQRLATLQNLQGLDTELLKLWEREAIDPALVQGMRRWQEDAGLP
jgi:hypothetical protein